MGESTVGFVYFVRGICYSRASWGEACSLLQKNFLPVGVDASLALASK